MDEIRRVRWIKFLLKIPLSPSMPTMYLNLMWGKNITHIPPYLVTSWRLDNSSADQPVGHMID